MFVNFDLQNISALSEGFLTVMRLEFKLYQSRICLINLNSIMLYCHRNSRKKQQIILLMCHLCSNVFGFIFAFFDKYCYLYNIYYNIKCFFLEHLMFSTRDNYNYQWMQAPKRRESMIVEVKVSRSKSLGPIHIALAECKTQPDKVYTITIGDADNTLSHIARGNRRKFD